LVDIEVPSPEGNAIDQRQFIARTHGPRLQRRTAQKARAERVERRSELLDDLIEMPRHEDPLTLAYWESHQEGTFILEPRVGTRRFDGLMIIGGEKRLARWSERSRGWLDFARGKELRVIQTKAGPLELPVMGQGLFSGRLARQLLAPSSVMSVIVCVEDDVELRRLLDDPRIAGEVVVEVISGTPGGYSRPGRNPPLIHRYHQDVHGGRGTLLLDYPIGPHVADAVLVLTGSPDAPKLAGCDIVILHATKFAGKGKQEPLGMSVMGMAVFSEALAKSELACASVKSHALCERKDADLDALLNPFRPTVDAVLV
jgi:hypothetical protein